MFGVSDEVLTLQQAADALGVHYMTAYRYVRLGLLDAHKAGGGWRVTRVALDDFEASRSGSAPAKMRPAPWADRLEARLVAGDAPGSWGVIEAAMAAGMSVGSVYIDVLSPALRSIGNRWSTGELDVAIEHRASGIASRLIGRLGSRCTRRGRPRGTILLGAPEGERHALVLAILGDLLRLEGWEVSDLGADTPTSSFVMAAQGVDDLSAIGVSVTSADNLGAAGEACGALREAGLSVPIVLGGMAVSDTAHARLLGADAFAHDAAEMMRVLDELAGSAA